MLWFYFIFNIIPMHLKLFIIYIIIDHNSLNTLFELIFIRITLCREVIILFNINDIFIHNFLYYIKSFFKIINIYYII